MDCTLNFVCQSNLREADLCAFFRSFNPILTLRFAISLRKAANPEGEQQWGVTHFNTPRFSGLVSPGVHAPAVYENFLEMDAVDSPPGRAQVSELRRSMMDV